MVAGGGTALAWAARKLQMDSESDDQRKGIEIVLHSLLEPLRQIAINAGKNPEAHPAPGRGDRRSAIRIRRQKRRLP